MILSEDLVEVIVANPLGKGLDEVRAQLRELTANVLSQDIIARLLGVFIGSTAVLRLPPRIPALLFSVQYDVRTGVLSLEIFRPLINLVIDNSPDTVVWAAVLDFLQDVKPSTPPPPPSGIPPTFHGTPIKASSGWLDDSETRSVVEGELFSEIKDCTFRNVEGFWNKFFSPDCWQQNHKHLLDRMLAEYSQKMWEFPATLDEISVWDWLRQLESRFLAGAPNKLYSTKSAYEFRERKGQIDVFFQSREPSEPFEFKHILVVGELKKSHDSSRFKANLLQLTRLVRGIFADQPTRRFVHAFTLCAYTMELWIFDRVGPYSSGTFDIRKDIEKFARAFIGYATMDDNSMGRDIFIQKEKGNYQVTLYDVNNNGSCSSTKETTLRLTRAMVKQQAIVCRGTTCYGTKDNQVAKFSWTSTKRKLEVDHLKLAKEKGVQGVARVVAYRQITTIAELRKGLKFPKPHQFRGESLSVNTSSYKRKSSDNTIASSSKRPRLPKDKGSSLAQELSSQLSSSRTKASDKMKPSEAEDPWDDRIYSCLVVSPAGRVISEFNSTRELLESMRDAIRAHQSLYTLGGILHRDISPNNIIITEPETTDGFKGMLIDLDLAKPIDGEPSGAHHLTGTTQFMAVQVLRRIDHTYRHDLESFFYVLLWMCIRVSQTKWQFGRGKVPREKSRLQKWGVGSFDDIADNKLYQMTYIDTITDEFPEALNVVKPLCLEIRNILFPQKEDFGRFCGTPTGSPDQLYGPIIAAYDRTIRGLPAIDRMAIITALPNFALSSRPSPV